MVPLCVLLAAPAVATPGGQLWARRYNGPANLYDAARALAVSPDGTKVFATGSSQSSPGANDYATVAWDAATGARLWAQPFDGPAHLDDQAEAIGVSPDGSTVFVTGTSGGTYGTVAYDASTGALRWVQHYDGPFNTDSEARAIGVSPDGSAVFVTGMSYGSWRTTIDHATVAYDATTGAKLWSRRYNGPLDSHDEANALAVSSDGSSLFVTGYSYGLTQRADYLTVGYDAASGRRLWVGRYAEESNENEDALGAKAVVVSPDGSSVFVTGRNRSATGNAFATVAYDSATGTQLWAKRYDGPGDSGGQANAIDISPDGSTVFVTGSTGGPTGTSDYATVAYDAATGVRRWLKRYNGPTDGFDFAYSLTASPDGSSVFVTGDSPGLDIATDYTTLAYDAMTGTKLWLTRYDGGARSVGVSPDGSKVFVTGLSVGPSNTVDYATVAYATV